MSGKNLLYSSIGFAIGGLAGFLYAKRIYGVRDEEEINKIRQMYKNKYENSVNNQLYSEPKPETPKVEEQVEELKYFEEVKEEAKKKNVDIQVISPLEYGMEPEYECETLSYYADRVLAYDDADDSLVENIDEVIGLDALELIGEYGNDVIYVRNDILKTYFEICRTEKTYAEVTGRY